MAKGHLYRVSFFTIYVTPVRLTSYETLAATPSHVRLGASCLAGPRTMPDQYRCVFASAPALVDDGWKHRLERRLVGGGRAGEGKMQKGRSASSRRLVAVSWWATPGCGACNRCHGYTAHLMVPVWPKSLSLFCRFLVEATALYTPLSQCAEWVKSSDCEA